MECFLERDGKGFDISVCVRGPVEIAPWGGEASGYGLSLEDSTEMKNIVFSFVVRGTVWVW